MVHKQSCSTSNSTTTWLVRELLGLLFLAVILADGAYLDDVKKCIPVVTSDHSKSGNFTSPNYPRYYPQLTHCRYDFVGHANERVQVVFTDFNLFHPDDGYTQRDPDRPRNPKEVERRRGRDLDCSATDVDILSAFVYNGEKLARIDDFCGSTPPLAVMSNSNRLTLEFKAPSSSTYVRGFSALYRFVTDFGITNGRQDPHLPCRFYFYSNETSNGTFTSPNYPGLYPRDTECHYFFQGKENEHVELHFTYFHIDGVQPCDEETYSDYVEFSNYIPTDRKYDRKCGTESGFKVRSDRKFFRVNFHSNDRYDATGFQATYQFSDKTNHLTIRNVRSNASTVETCFMLVAIVGMLAFLVNFLSDYQSSFKAQKEFRSFMGAAMQEDDRNRFEEAKRTGTMPELNECKSKERDMQIV